MQAVCIVALLIPPGLLCTAAGAQEAPTFITYTHQMEEPGNLDLEFRSVTGNPDRGDRFVASAVELEYGVRAWWTTEFYLDGQSTAHESTLFTGFRWENRFHVLRGEHWINPVLYVEFEDINGAEKNVLEVVGHDAQAGLLRPNDAERREKKRELETKLILGSYAKGWTIAENLIVERNLARGEPIEFGYAAAVSRPLALAARPDPCVFCRENFQAGVELYGGLGTHNSFGLADTSHYLAPLLAWSLPDGPAFKLSAGFGLTDSSVPLLLRFGVSYELQQVGRYFRRGGGR